MPVSLTKGQRISLEKEAGHALTTVVMGLGWDAVKKGGFLGFLGGGGNIDLDASCILFDDSRRAIDAVWFRQLSSKDGSIRHTGDNLTGDGEGDDEQIIVDLSRIPGQVSSMVFVVTSFSGQTFTEVANAFCRLVDQRTGREIARYNLSGFQGRHTAMVMAKVYRHSGEWKMHAIGEPANGRTYQDVLPAALAVV